MKRIGALLTAITCIVLANLAWVWLQRHDATLRIERRVEARRQTAGGDLHEGASTGVKITQFYATAAEMTDAEHNTICYGVENAKAVRIEPAVANLTPALTRCFWVEPKQDTTYRLIAEGPDGSEDSASFQLRVKPAPPSILFMELSHREIQRGEPVTLCYGVERANHVRLQPLGLLLAASRKDCVRFYPPASMKYTLVAAGAGGATERVPFDIKVR